MLTPPFLCDTPTMPGAGTPPPPLTPDLPPVDEQNSPRTLYVILGPDGAVKIGTCAHCILLEPGRPARAWTADGDQALDFERDLLFAHLEDLGLTLTHRQAYVCP